MKVTIDRSKWRRGDTGSGDTQLLNKEGYMCCLGFCALAAGLTEEQIINRATPRQVPVRGEWELFWQALNGLSVSTKLTREAVYLNDTHSMTDEKREKELIKLLGEAGVEVSFE